MPARTRSAVCLVILLLAQTAFIHRVSYRFIRFDLVGIFAAYMALEARFESSLAWALAAGVGKSLLSMEPLGLSALLYVIAVFGICGIRGSLVRENPLVNVLLVFLFVLFPALLQALVLALLGPGVHLAGLLPRAAGVAACSALVSPFFFAVFDLCSLVRSAGSALE